MDPERHLEKLCEERGLPPAEGQHLLPLVKRALGLPVELRERLLRVVAASLDRRAQELADRQRLQAYLDEQCLKSVAAVMHGWVLPEQGS